jgi:hypothetical protein
VSPLVVLALLGANEPLTFRWPDHLRCEVERKERTELHRGKVVEQVDRYRLEASREKGGWMIRRSYLGGTDEKTSGESARRAEWKGDRLPAFRIRSNGAFAGLVIDRAGRERLRAQEREWRTQGSLDGKETTLTKGMPYPGSEAQLAAHTRGDWMDLVEGWLGGPLPREAPAVREAQSEIALPFVGEMRVKFREQRRLVKSAPCVEGGPIACVELESVSEPDLADVNRNLTASMRGQGAAAPGKPAPPFEVSRMNVRRTLITDPRTMVPARFHKRMEMESKGAGPGAEPWNREETLTFACAPSP